MTQVSIAELSADTSLLISELSQCERGSVVTYAEHFTKWLGRTIHNRGDMPTFATVRKRLLTEYSLVLSTIPKVGYKILTHSEALNSKQQMTRVSRTAKVREKELIAVDFNSLDQSQRTQWAAKLAQSKLVQTSASDKQLKQLESNTTAEDARQRAIEAARRA